MNDILKVKFLEGMAETKVNLAIGTTFMTARGEVIEDFEGKLLKVAFPNSIFLSIEHPDEDNPNKSSRFSFEFWYKDQDSLDEDAE